MTANNTQLIASDTICAIATPPGVGGVGVIRISGPLCTSIAGQMLVLGCIFVMLAVISDSMYALLAGTIGQWIKGSGAVMRAERYIVGSVYIGLGVAAALADTRQH